MPKNKRVVDLNTLADPNSIESTEFNWQSGGKKSLHIGPHLLPIPTGAASWTTNASARLGLPVAGMNLAVYNNAGAVGSVSIGDNTITALAAGAVDASGRVGVACPPNAWTYISMGNNRFVITTAATLLTYIIEDDTSIAQQ